MANEKERIFTQELYTWFQNDKSDKLLLPKEKLNGIVERLNVLTLEQNPKKTREDYYLLSRFEVLKIGDLEKLIKRRKSEEDSIRYFISIEETFDIIKKSHYALNHAGRDKMLKELGRKYCNITVNAINLFKSMCDECQLRRKNPCKGVVVKPILSKDFNSRGQVDLIDMQSMADGNYRFIMNYQDHLTKFCILESLTSKRAAEVAYKLLTSVFFVFGAPHILQSDNGREFTANIILELKEIWPELVIVHGKPRHPQSQGSVERSNGDVHDMLVSWMRDNHTTKWSTGIKFVQFQKNRRDHSGIKRSPYEAMFGCAPKIGLSSSSIPEEILLTLQQEEDLQIHEPQNTSSENNNPEVSSQTQQSPPNLRRDPTETTEGFLLEFERECTVCNALFQTDDNNQNSCDICCRSQNIQRERHASASNMCKQAEKMITRSNQILRPVQVHDNVTIPIPAVDRGRGDPRNLLCLILEVDEANAQFKLGTKHGILHGAFSRNQFLPSSVHSLMVDDINRENEISVREAARLQSVGDGQGFMKCTCKSGCIRRTCKCLKANLLCNSRCHNSLSCRNK